MSAPEEEDIIAIGDVVEHKMNTNVFGIVVGGGGSLVYVRLSPTLETAIFHEWELRLVEDDEYLEPEPGAAAPEEDSNVIDFTRARDLRSAKTRGAA